ncbi:chemotaxis protein CheB [Belnapia sp. T18]|uniref:protein-glutamate methylesterase n=1 Tax=Belnapia arida TaxID=2804533 RepID=A0ABS1U5E7_9PROT|nr:chemotaxis protein CheB [Belnapia arida]MBL6079883.1 chemotaxis protein CheB [Belnapia arida]
MGHDIIVVGASAGGVEALQRLSAGLSPELPAAVLIVQHVSPRARSVLPELLARAGPMPVAHALDGEPILPGRAYVAPPDHHLLVAPGGQHLLLRRGPLENRTRPAVDALFRSAAVTCGPRVIGVVLTGTLDDGTAGLVAVKRCGGISVVQDPADAVWPDMPRNALNGDSPDHSAPMALMVPLLDRLARSPAGPAIPIPLDLQIEARIARQELAAMGQDLVGLPSQISCPDCGGVLNEVREEKLIRFRCQIGHAYGAESLAAAQADGLENAMAVAARTHRDRLVLFRRMETSAAERGMTYSAARWHQAALEAERSADLIADAIKTMRIGNLPAGPPGDSIV